jgi:hypothetical protein
MIIIISVRNVSFLPEYIMLLLLMIIIIIIVNIYQIIVTVTVTVINCLLYFKPMNLFLHKLILRLERLLPLRLMLDNSR